MRYPFTKGSVSALFGWILSARMKVKQDNFETERLLTDYAEPMAVFAALCGAVYPQEFVDNCEQYLINNHCFSPDKVNEICEQARHYLVEKMFETHSLDMNNSVLASPEDL